MPERDRMTQGPTVNVGARRLTQGDLEQLCADIVTAAERLKAGHYPGRGKRRRWHDAEAGVNEPTVLGVGELLRRNAEGVGGDGFPAGGDGGPRGSDVADPVFGAYSARMEHDRVDLHVQAMAAHLQAARDEIVAAVSRSYAVSQWQDWAKSQKDDAAGLCVNCGEPPDGPLKAGRCDACRVYRMRNDGRERPGDLIVRAIERRREQAS